MTSTKNTHMASSDIIKINSANNNTDTLTSYRFSENKNVLLYMVKYINL